MSRIDPSIVHLNTPLNLSRENMIEILKKPYFGTEGIYSCNFPINKLNPFGYENLYTTAIYKYFNHGIYWDKSNIDYLIHHHADEFRYSLETYLKLTWLSNEYKHKGKFKYPVSIHYNPRTNMFVVNPGIVRTATANIFSDKIHAFYFATRGYIPEFLSEFKKIDYNSIEDDAKIHVVADHGSIIPYIAFNDNIRNDILCYHSILQKLFLKHKLKISSNYDITRFINPRFLDKEGDIKITFFKEPTTAEIQKALIFISHGGCKNNVFKIKY